MERTYTDDELEGMKPENRPKTVFEGREYDDYQATQMQRRIERTIRKQKRLKNAYEAAGLTDDAQTANIRLRRLNEKYREFSKAARLPEQRERLRVLNQSPLLTTASDGKITKPGEIFHPESAVNSLQKRLEKTPGMSDNINVLRYYARSTDFVKDTTINGPIGYDPQNDVIRFNPNIPLPDGIDRDGILAHELAHRADALFYKASINPYWQDAVRKAEDLIKGHESEIEALFSETGKYRNDGFLSDIISALSLNTIDVPYFHPMNYWVDPLNQAREVFANLAAIDVLSGGDSLSTIKELSGLAKAFKKIIHSGGIA